MAKRILDWKNRNFRFEKPEKVILLVSFLLLLGLSYFSFNLSIAFSVNVPQARTMKDIFQEVLVEKGFNVLVREDLPVLLDEREKISLKVFKGKSLDNLKASDFLVLVSTELLDLGNYNVSLKVVNVESGEIVLVKNYEIFDLSTQNIEKIALDFSDALLKYLDYKNFSKKAFDVQVYLDKRSGPLLLKIIGLRNGWLKIFISEGEFLRLIDEFQILANKEYDFIVSEGNGLNLRLLWLPKYVEGDYIMDFSDFKNKIKEEGIEDWYIKDLEF
jgi:hypothetical protein